MADEYVVERRTTISASPAEVFARVGNLEGWDDWSPWAEMDPDMAKTYDGEPGEVGSSYHWVGNRKVGEGRMTLTDVRTDERVSVDLEFLKPYKSESKVDFTVAETAGGTEAVWRMTGERTFMVKVMGMFGKNMDKMVGPDFEKGLASLKTLCEQ